MNTKSSSADWLFNPFERIAGGPALISGLALIFSASWLGSLKGIHFDGVLDTHIGPRAPLHLFVGEGLIDWSVMSLCLWIAGKCVSRASFRSLDLFGTQALARWPSLISASVALLPAFHRFSDQLMNLMSGSSKNADMNLGTGDSLIFLAVTMVNLACTAWMVALMWKSFSLCCHVKGPKAVVAFVVSVVAAEILSKIAILQLLTPFCA